MKKGMVFNIQRFSLNDGDGIRTIIFLKGCPLVCQWCSNPESQKIKSQNVYSKRNCISCRRCVEDIYTSSEWTEIDLNDRTAKKCPTEALSLTGKLMSIDDIIDEVKKDEKIFDISGGGVTLSGGEPFYQHAFVEELVAVLKEKYYNIAIETTGYANWKMISKSIPLFDTILYDIKHMNPEIHKKYTGVSNQLILENLEKASELNKNIIIRIPLIAGVNDDIANVEKTCKLAIRNSIKEIHVLPYHKFGEVKYQKLDRPYKYRFEAPDNQAIDRIGNVIYSYGLDFKIGG